MEFGEQAVRHAAAAAQELADQVRRIALQAVAEAELGWRSSAAEEFRQRLAGEGTAIRECAAQLDHAAGLLRRHADRCQQVAARLPVPW